MRSLVLSLSSTVLLVVGFVATALTAGLAIRFPAGLAAVLASPLVVALDRSIVDVLVDLDNTFWKD